MREMESEEKKMSAVIRTMTILETLSRRSSANLESLSAETGIPKATLLRFLNTLTETGYIHRDAGDLYHLSLKMFSVGSRSLQHVELINTAMPFTASLRDIFGEAVHMGILQDDNSAVYVIKEESKHNLRMYSRVGKTIPLYCTAIGKIFLSEMTEEELENYFSNNRLIPFTEKSIRTKEDMLKELEEVREQGYAMDNEENEANIVCIGAPVKNYTGSVVAAISVSWPIFRFSKEECKMWAETIKEKAAELSRVLGYLA